MARGSQETRDWEVFAHADLSVPSQARGIVLFAHGTGSGRHSPRNRHVAEQLQQRGLATLLMDLLTEEEEYAERSTRHLRFDIGLLAGRLSKATESVISHPATRGLPIGYFGASTGAAAALIAASESDEVGAVVSRGGRPDLAGAALARVRAPTLLIVGSRDEVVLDLNRDAFDQLRCEKSLHIVEGATHLFEEPGAMDEVSRVAGEWFVNRLAPS